MTGYGKINLQDMSEMIGVEELQSIISDFSCPLNNDVQTFLTEKAVEFSKQGISATYLVFASYRKNPVLAGYFTLALKVFHIGLKQARISNTLKKRIRRFSIYNEDIKRDIVAAPLIAQIGKNYTNGYNDLISGDELLQLACDTVADAQRLLGGRFVYLECEDTSRLLEFYESNGFYNFGQRPLDPDETGLKGKYLVQMLKYLR